MNETIQRYLELGWPMTPLHGKRAYVEEWTTKPVPANDIDNLMKKGENVGILTGLMTKTGYALIRIDVDYPGLINWNSEALEKQGAMTYHSGSNKSWVLYTRDIELSQLNKKVTIKRDQLEPDEATQLSADDADKDSLELFAIQAKGGQFMAPPSVHPETKRISQWINGPHPPEKTLIINDAHQLKKILNDCIGNRKWLLEDILPEDTPDEDKAANGNTPNEILQGYLSQIYSVLGKGEDRGKYTRHLCPFHTERHSSFIVNKEKFYAYDYHDEQKYSLKKLAEKLQIRLSTPSVVDYLNIKSGEIYPTPPGGGKNIKSPQEVIKNKTPPGGGEYISEDTLDHALEATIKGDEVNRKILFIGSLLNYTKEDQLNFGLSGDSSSGKSHNCLEVAALHPADVVMKLSYTSPKAFFHDKGVLIDDKTGEQMINRGEFIDQAVENWDEANPKPAPRSPDLADWKDQRKVEVKKAARFWDKYPKHLRVDLKQKILVFVDMPSPELLTYLRSLLSHDEPSIWIKITDKGKSGQNQTKNVEIIGYPTLFFNSTGFAMDAQEQTRLFLLSPGTDSEKFKLTLPFIAEKVSDRPRFKAKLDSHPDRNQVKRLIEYIRGYGIQEIIIKPEDRDRIVKRFMEEHKNLKARYQRDLPRLLALVKGYTLFNAAIRNVDENGNLHAEAEDVENGYNLYKKVSNSNELGLPPHVYEFFKEVMEPELSQGFGFTRRELSKEYFKRFKSHVGEKQLGRIIQLLSETGLVIEEADPNDKRSKRVFSAEREPVELSEEEKEEDKKSKKKGQKKL